MEHGKVLTISINCESVDNAIRLFQAMREKLGEAHKPILFPVLEVNAEAIGRRIRGIRPDIVIIDDPQIAVNEEAQISALRQSSLFDIVPDGCCVSEDWQEAEFRKIRLQKEERKSWRQREREMGKLKQPKWTMDRPRRGR